MKRAQVLINALIIYTLLFNIMSYAEPPNLSLLRERLEHYHDSGAYQHELNEVITKAETAIMQSAATIKGRNPQARLAIALDIDETSLSNYNKMLKRQFLGTQTMIHQDIVAADAPAIQSTLKLYNRMITNNIAVFFISGRHEADRDLTIKNLKYRGYHNWSGLYLRADDDHLASVVSFKAHTRAMLLKKGYTIIASVGDQCSDLIGGYTQLRFKLPNPYYYLH